MFENLKSRLHTEWEQTSAYQWLQGLPPRDRQIVQGIALAAVLGLVWVLIWQPVTDWRTANDARYRQAVATLHWIERHDGELRAARDARRGNGRGGQGGLMMAQVANSAANSGIQLSRVQPETGGFSVTLQDQEFNAVIGWLNELSTREQVGIRQLSIDAQTSPGLVSARINLN
jgi:general secretion pathway protein M